MSSGVRAPRGALGRDHPVATPGCSSVWSEHPVRGRGVGGSNLFNQTAVIEHRSIREWSSGTDARLWTERRWFESIFPSTGEAPENASSGRSSSIGRAPPRQGGGNGIETRLWRKTLVVKRMITGDYESPVPGSNPGRGASSS